MARNLNVAWVYPTTRESTKPLDPADIASVEISLSVDNVNWSLYDTFPNGVLSTVIPELEIGEWFVQGVVVDTAGKRSKPKVGSKVVPDDTAPGTLELTLSF
jgi:hypothetical protein